MFESETGFRAQDGMTSVRGDGKAGANLDMATRSRGEDSRDASLLREQILRFGLHQKMEIGKAFRFGGEEVEKIPLRHQGDEFAAGGKAREIAHREMPVADVHARAFDLRVGQSEEPLKKSQLVHDLQGRGVHRVAAKIAQEVLVLFQ